MEQLARLLQDTLAPNEAIRKPAEVELLQLRESHEKRQQLCACLFDILLCENVPIGIRQAAAIFLQNTVKAHWSAESDFPMSEEEKSFLRSNLLDAVFRADQKIRNALTWSIAKISEFDFPGNWPEALGMIKAKLEQQVNDISRIAFEIIIALLNKYDAHMGLTQDIIPELIKVNKELADVSLIALEQAASTSDFITATLGAQVFYHLCKLDFSDEIEEALPRWMKQFHTYLQYPENAATRSLKSAAINSVNLFLRKYSEDFEKYKDHFIPIIWKLLCDDQENADDRIKVSGLEFLTTVARSNFWESLASEETLRLIMDQVIIRNIFARPYEIERITDDYVEYIRTDIEGSDSATRRRAACNLASAMIGDKLGTLGRPIVTTAISSLLQTAYGNMSKHWIEMDAAMCLIFALSVKSEQRSLNNAFVSDALCNLEDVYQRFVLPELSSKAVEHIVLKADALKFVCHFRHNFPTNLLMDLLCLVGEWIGHENCVLAIYAAHCIDQIFTINQLNIRVLLPIPKAGVLGLRILSSLELHAPCDADRIAKALYSLVREYKADIAEINNPVLAFAERQLKRAIEVEVDAVYLHYLLESLGSVLSTQNINDFQSRLFEICVLILQQNVEHLVPYAVQLVAQCVRISEGAYEGPLLLVSGILNQPFCTNRQYVPSVVLVVSTVLNIILLRVYTTTSHMHSISLTTLHLQNRLTTKGFLSWQPVWKTGLKQLFKGK